MAKKADPRTKKPLKAHGRSLSDFGKLSAAENDFIKACQRGEVCKLGDGKRPEKATDANTIHPGLIRFLALGGDDDAPVHEMGVRLQGAWVEGTLDLESCACPVDIALLHCRLDGDVVLQGSRLATFSLEGSSIKSFQGDRVRIAGSLHFRNGFRAEGEVSLLGARIGGNLSCRNGAFSPRKGPAFSSDHAVIKGDVFLNDGFRAAGEVRFPGARIGGNLSCRNGAFSPRKGNALSCDRALIKGEVFLDEGFKTEGTVRFPGAQIGGSLNCTNGAFSQKVGHALFCDHAVIMGNVSLGVEFKAEGEVSLLGAQIGGNLDCRKGAFSPRKGDALSCDGAVIKGSVFLDEGFKTESTVRLPGAKIGGDLSCGIGTSTPEKKAADENMFGKYEEVALACDGATVSGTLFFRNVVSVGGSVLLSGCHAHHLADDAASWSKVPGLILDGFTYDRIIDGPTDAATRIAWLKRPLPKNLRDQSFQPQPWEQCIKVLREMGHEADARAVAIAKQEAMREAGVIKGLLGRPLHWLYGILAGYGYRPLRTIGAMLLVFALGHHVFDYADQRGWMGPTSPIIHADPAIAEACGRSSGPRLTTWTICPALPNEYTTYNPLLYSLDLVLPLVDLQQEKDWAPIVTVNGSEWTWPRALVRFYMWFEILFGWAMSLLLAAVLGNLVKKD